jgi:hypothetical protein
VAEAGKVTCQSIFSLSPEINREIRLSANRIVVDVIPLWARLEPRGEAYRGRPCLARVRGSGHTQIWSQADQSADKRAARQGRRVFAWCNVRPTLPAPGATPDTPRCGG